MSNVYKFYSARSADNVLEQCIDCFDSVLVIGYDKEGDLDVRATTNLCKKDLNWLVDQAKDLILRTDDED